MEESNLNRCIDLTVLSSEQCSASRNQSLLYKIKKIKFQPKFDPNVFFNGTEPDVLEHRDLFSISRFDVRASEWLRKWLLLARTVLDDSIGLLPWHSMLEKEYGE